MKKANEIVIARISAIKSEISDDIMRGHTYSATNLEKELQKVEALKEITEGMSSEGNEHSLSLVKEIIDDLRHSHIWSYENNMKKLKKIASLYKETKKESTLADFPLCEMAVQFLIGYYKMTERDAIEILKSMSARDNCTVDIALSRAIRILADK